MWGLVDTTVIGEYQTQTRGAEMRCQVYSNLPTLATNGGNNENGLNITCVRTRTNSRLT